VLDFGRISAIKVICVFISTIEAQKLALTEFKEADLLYRS